MIYDLYKRPISIISFFVIFLIIGLISFFKLSYSILPDIEYPILIIQTEYKDASSSEVEEKITSILEKNIATISGLKYYRSVSYAEKSQIYLIFRENKDSRLDEYYLKTKEKVEIARNMLPDKASYPVISLFDSDNSAFFSFACSEKRVEDEEYQDYIKNTIESIDGVSSVKVAGNSQKEYFIEFYYSKIHSLKLSFSDILDRIKRNNIDFPGGKIDLSGKIMNINIKGSYKSIENIENILIKIDKKKGTNIYLKDIAKVTSIKKEKRVCVVDGKKSSLFEVFTNNNTDLYSLGNRIKNTLENEKIEYTLVSDSSNYIKTSVNELFSAIITALMLTFIVVYIFFKDVLVSFLISLTIPVSLIINFSFMYFFNINLNTLSLSGLVISVGLLVDNAIVIGEKLTYFYSLGIKDYIKKTLSSTVGPVISSVLTTIIAFFPVVFLKGITGEFFRQEAIAITFTLVISLFISIFMLPAVFDLIKKRVILKNKNRSLHFIKNVIIGLFSFFTKIKLLSLVLIIILSSLSVFLFYTWDKEFLPFFIEDEINISIDMSSNSEDVISFETINLDQFLSNNKESINKYSIVTDFYGSKIDLVINFNNKSKYTFFERLKKYFELRSIPSEYILNPSWNIPKDFQMFLRLNIYEENLLKINDILKNLNEKILIENEFDEIKIKNTLKIIPSVEKMELLAIDREEIRQTLRSYFSSEKITDLFFDGFNELKINSIPGVYNIENIKITTNNGNTVFLKDIADIDEGIESEPIFRYEGNRYTEVRYNVFNNIDKTMNNISEKLKEAHEDFEFKGINEMKDTMIEDLMFSLFLAIFLIYLVLVIQYESFITPLFILIFIPPVYAGSFLMMYWTNTAINLMSMLGIIILTGITVNNSIILITEIKRGGSIKKAVIRRIRAILITTATTVFGSIPMLFGNAYELRAPLAIALIGGMIISWSITLFFLPAVYSFFYRKRL